MTENANIELLFECDGTPSVPWRVENGTFTNELNKPYSVSLVLSTNDIDAEPVQMLGQPAKLLLTRDAVMRQITGIVSEVRAGGTSREALTATVVVEPALRALEHRVNTKIFQEMTVPEILEEVLNEGLGAWNRSVDNRTSRIYPTCEYRVQYNESDLEFCERLMEEEGIVYWFDLEDEAETLVLVDGVSDWSRVEGLHGDTLEFSLQEGQTGAQEYVREFHGVSQLIPTKVATRHFDWTHPAVPIEGENSDAVEGSRPHGGVVSPDREVYEEDERKLTLSEYGGAAFGANDVEEQARLRRETQSWEAFVCTGRSTVLQMLVGATFELVGHTNADLDGRYLITSVSHDFTGTGRDFGNSFECIPEGVPFRPRRRTPRPRIASIQTAKVVGPSGEEIHTDEHGRIKVQFHWDRLGANDENSSCWVRVLQPWAGAGWGFVFIPRMGMEVVVRFIDGDPDRPVVIGSVFNGEQPPPYALPDEKTKSTLKTETSLGGGGYNEWRFEDKAGEEEIFTHAQRDENEVMENDHNTNVGHDQTNTVDNDQTQDVGNNQNEHVIANQDLEVDANRTIQVHGDFTETIDGSETRTVSSSTTETIDAGETRTVTGGMTETISGGREQTINGDSTESINGALTQTITGGAKISTPATYDITAAAGVTIIAPAGMEVLSPGGHTLIAPGGQHYIDQNQNNSGTTDQQIFNVKTDIVGANLGVVGGIALTFTGIDFETSGIKTGHIGAAMDNSPTDFKTATVDINKKLAEIDICGAGIFF